MKTIFLLVGGCEQKHTKTTCGSNFPLIIRVKVPKISKTPPSVKKRHGIFTYYIDPMGI